MDLSTIIGAISGILLFGGAIILGGNAVIFLSLQSIMIVLGGTLAGTMISFSFADLLKTPSLLKITLQEHTIESDGVIDILVEFAEKARREGLLALEDNVREIDESFLQKGIQLVIDGTDPELVRNILETKLTFLEERHSQGRRIFETMGQLAPAFGMIGTLIGLIQMLSQLDNPDNLGSGMAVALITTLYGATLANLLFIPLAKKLKTRTEEEVLMKEVIIEGILSIQAGENPRIIKEKLEAFLSPEGEESEEEAQEELDTSAVSENA